MRHEPEKWRSDYERDGHLVVEDCLDSGLLGKLRNGMDRIARGLDDLPPLLRRHVHLEKDYRAAQPGLSELPEKKLGQAIKVIMELPLFDRVFADLIC
jgi:hypothetical protein